MNPDEMSMYEQLNSDVPEAASTTVTSEVADEAEAHQTEVDTPDGNLQQQVETLRGELTELKAEIDTLKTVKSQLLQQQLQEFQAALQQLTQASLQTWEARHQNLQNSIERLERREARIQAEMRRSFAGASQDVAIRVQGFKDYLVNSLQDLVVSAEQLELVPERPPEPEANQTSQAEAEAAPSPLPQFAEQSFQEQARQIRKLVDQYRNAPNYYGPPWHLRRTFEPSHAERVNTWFFTQGGRGALRTMGSRLQNILVASALISILRRLYGDRVRSLILANSPEHLGDWRRGLQDCLGISRTDFGPDQGIVLFESADSLVQKADRLVKDDLLPLILIDDSEEQVNLSMLQFPLWMAFAPEPQLRQRRSSSFDFFE